MRYTVTQIAIPVVWAAFIVVTTRPGRPKGGQGLPRYKVIVPVRYYRLSRIVAIRYAASVYRSAERIMLLRIMYIMSYWSCNQRLAS